MIKHPSAKIRISNMRDPWTSIPSATTKLMPFSPSYKTSSVNPNRNFLKRSNTNFQPNLKPKKYTNKLPRKLKM
jgi:hypothetical protein